MQRLAELLRPTEALLISDEVYEHMVFDGRRHESVARHAELAARSFIVSSFGKTFHVTGWKVGYVAAPRALTEEFRKVHQFNVFTVNTPMQHGLAAYLEDPAPYLGLSAFYAAKRDHFRAGLERTRLRLLPCEGSYFQCVDYSAISEPGRRTRSAAGSLRTSAWRRFRLSAFYPGPFEQRIVRFCFAKTHGDAGRSAVSPGQALVATRYFGPLRPREPALLAPRSAHSPPVCEPNRKSASL